MGTRVVGVLLVKSVDVLRRKFDATKRDFFRAGPFATITPSPTTKEITLSLKNAGASISVDGANLPGDNVVVDERKKLDTCWIPSEAEKVCHPDVEGYQVLTYTNAAHLVLYASLETFCTESLSRLFLLHD